MIVRTAYRILELLVNDGVHHDRAQEIGVGDTGSPHEQVAVALGGQAFARIVKQAFAAHHLREDEEEEEVLTRFDRGCIEATKMLCI